MASLARRLPNATVLVHPGCALVKARRRQPSIALGPDGLVVTEENVIHDTTQIAAAVAIAARSDLVILAVGDRSGHFRTGTTGEGSDTSDLALPGAQAALADALLATGKSIIVVLQTGRAYSLGPLASGANAILVGWFLGQVGADVLSDTLIGSLEPGGRLPITFAGSPGQQPRVYNARKLDAGVPRARDYAPDFSFGHGMSWTSFKITDACLGVASIATDGLAVVTCRVTNTGTCAGETVVQLYARDPIAQTPRPHKELKGFKRLALKPGTSTDLRVEIPADLFAYIGIDMARAVDPGEIMLWIGFASDDETHPLGLELTGNRRTIDVPCAWSASITEVTH